VTLRQLGTEVGHRGHGTCHRCGWVVDINRINRKQARRLHMGSHPARICDECLEDLKRGPVVAIGAKAPAHVGASTTRSRVVA